jgi:hypothetical protein
MTQAVLARSMSVYPRAKFTGDRADWMYLTGRPMNPRPLLATGLVLASLPDLAAGGRYEKTRLRLDDDVAPGRVGEDIAVPVFALAEYTLSPNARRSVLTGVEVDDSLRLEDASGRKVRESDLSNAPFIGASFQARF